MQRFGPKVYRSMDEFQREEIAPHMKAGFCLDDDKRELDFDF